MYEIVGCRQGICRVVAYNKIYRCTYLNKIVRMNSHPIQRIICAKNVKTQDCQMVYLQFCRYIFKNANFGIYWKALEWELLIYCMAI
jgi:hypothetical protein